MNSKDKKRIWEHIETINDELGEVKEHFASMATDVKWLKEKTDRIDTRLWFIVSGLLVTILLTVITLIV